MSPLKRVRWKKERTNGVKKPFTAFLKPFKNFKALFRE
jgi:hypothetical protein